MTTRNLKPGGWIEIHECIPFLSSEDGTVDDDHPMNKLYRLLDGPFTRVFGWNLRFPCQIMETLQEVGFVNLQERHSLIPLGRWHHETRMREMGVFSQDLCTDWIIALLSRNETMGLTVEEADELGQNILDAYNNPRIHGQLDWIDCWAQKPLS